MYYKYLINEYSPKEEGKVPVVTKTTTVFTNDSKELKKVAGTIVHVGKLSKEQLDKLTGKENVEVHTVK